MATLFPGGVLTPFISGLTVGEYIAPTRLPDLGGNVVVPGATRLPENQYPIEQLLQPDQAASAGSFNPKTWLNTDDLPPAFFRGSPYKQSGELQLFVLVRADKDLPTASSSSLSTSPEAPTTGGGNPSVFGGDFIRLGSKGEAVSTIQEELKRRGFLGGVIDGDFGSVTEQAVRDFQQSVGLEADGVVGELTRSSLFIPGSVDTQEARDSVRANLDPGGVGIFSPPKVLLTDTAFFPDSSSSIATSVMERGVEVDFFTQPAELSFPPELPGFDLESVFAQFLGSLSPGGSGVTTPLPVFSPNLSKITWGSAPAGEASATAEAPAPTGTEASSTTAEAGEASVPERWEFIVPPNTVSWSKSGEHSIGNPYGANRKYVYYSNTSMRNLSLSEVNLEGFAVGKSVEGKIKDLERCMEIERNPNGFLSPYVWKLYGLGKLYGFFLITSVSVVEVLRDEKGRATRATVSIELVEVPEYQVYDGRDLSRSGDLAKSNFSVCSSSTGGIGSFGQNGAPGTGGGAGSLGASGQVTGATAELLSRIRSGEGDYTSINRGVAGDTPGGFPGLTELSIAEVMALQDRGEAFAVGAYQFIPGTLKEAVAQSGIDPSLKFDKNAQDRLAMGLILGGQKRPRLTNYLTGRSNDLNAALTDISLEWASVTGAGGVGAYDGDSAGNKASVSVSDLLPLVREEVLRGN